MRLAALPRIDFAGLAALQSAGAGSASGNSVVVLCADAQHAVDLRGVFARYRQSQEAGPWQALATATIAQWLDHVVSAALLAGDPVPRLPAGGVLTALQEAFVWGMVVTEALGDDADTLLDATALARTAADAWRLERRWGIRVPDGWPDAEYQAYAGWREAFRHRCQRAAVVDATEALFWRLRCVQGGTGRLPEEIVFSGLHAEDAVLDSLLAALSGRGVRLSRLEPGAGTMPAVAQYRAPDAPGEEQAAACWARELLRRRPAANVRILVADLEGRRASIARELTKALGPTAEGRPCWRFVRGEPLSSRPAVAVALRLLRLATKPQALSLAEFGELLCHPGWAAGLEADGCALWEADLRQHLPVESAWAGYVAALRSSRWRDHLPQTGAALEAVLAAQRLSSRLRVPGDWAKAWLDGLAAAGWPGTLMATDRAGVEGLLARLGELADLDETSGKCDGATALRALADACRARAPGAARSGSIRVEVAALDDVPAGPCDGSWVIGANDHLWPGAVQANPLLPAAIQRSAGIPEASPQGRQAVSEVTWDALCRLASEAVFSWASREGERTLRPAPRIAGLPVMELAMPDPLPAGLVALESVEDTAGIPVAEGEAVHGGTGLLRAQSVCPAWGYFRYRLGITALEAPRQPLDARARGELLHAALEGFWRGRDSATVWGWPADHCEAVLHEAISVALSRYEAKTALLLVPALRRLEALRLFRVIRRWLELERQRSPFVVIDCEARQTLMIDGLAIHVVLDRIDRTEDDRLVVLDYKSGTSAAASGWTRDRLTEPQLPAYVAFGFPDAELAAVAIARVTRQNPGFSGVAGMDGVLPRVTTPAGDTRRFPAERFPDLAALRAHWARSLQAVAAEVMGGEAAVRVWDEDALAYCDVLPLLRLAERSAAWQAQG